MLCLMPRRFFWQSKRVRGCSSLECYGNLEFLANIEHLSIKGGVFIILGVFSPSCGHFIPNWQHFHPINLKETNRIRWQGIETIQLDSWLAAAIRWCLGCVYYYYFSLIYFQTKPHTFLSMHCTINSLSTIYMDVHTLLPRSRGSKKSIAILDVSYCKW